MRKIFSLLYLSFFISGCGGFDVEVGSSEDILIGLVIIFAFGLPIIISLKK